MTQPKIVAVNDNTGTAGAIVYWRLSGDTDYTKLEQAWLEAGLEAGQLPLLPSPNVALTRAVQTHSEKRLLVRPLEGERGWALVAEKAKGKELSHGVNLIVTLDEFGQLQTEPAEHPMKAALTTEYRKALDTLTGRDVSSWLVDLTRRTNAVLLRDTGGIYFVPRHNLDTWRLITGAIKAASDHAFFEIPALASDEAVEAILDAILRESEAAAEEMEEDLKAGVGKRAIQARQTRTDAVENKLSSYEALLGKSLDAMRDRLHRLRADLGRALLTAEGASQDEAVAAMLADL